MSFLDFIAHPVGKYFFRLLILIFYLGIPIYSLIHFWRRKYTNLWQWLVNTSMTMAYFCFLFWAGPWAMTYGLLFRNFLLVALLVTLLRSFVLLKKNLSSKKFKISTMRIINMGILALLCCDIFIVYQGTISPQNSLELEFPLKNGKYSVIQGGANEVLNHHFPVSAQKYALDIVKLNRFGAEAKKVFSKSLSDYCIFEEKVYSPCRGVVIAAVDGQEDLKPLNYDPENPLGNYIAIAMDGCEATIILAHLQKGSIKITSGDRVAKGQFIGNVGNSGNTSSPHLHIHAVKKGEEDILFNGEGLPIKFNKRFLTRNSQI